MTVINIVCTIIIIMLIVAIITRKKNRDGQQYHTTLPKIIQLKALITLLQKHRGMCASFLQGDKEALTVINTLPPKIGTLITQLSTSPLISQQQRWLGFTDHWKRLKDHAIKISVEQSFEQHTNLVANLLYLLEDVAEQQGLDKATFKHMPHISLLWRELPFTAEYIGQSRALGMAVTTAGLATQVDKVKLGYLEKKISQLVTDVFQQLQVSGEVSSEQHKFIQLATEACQEFTHIIRERILENNQTTIQPSEYFAAATQSMDAIHRVLDNELQVLNVFVKKYY